MPVRIFKKLQTYSRAFLKKYFLPSWYVFLQDAAFVFMSFLLAYLLRFNFSSSGFSPNIALEHSMLALSIYVIYGLVFKQYSGIIRHTTIRDIFNIFMANTAAMFTLLLITLNGRWYLQNELFNIPLSILVIHYITVTAMLLLIRISIRMFYEMVTHQTINKKNILIYGAGVMGNIVKQTILSDAGSCYHIEGFLDDSKRLHSKKLNGIPIYDPAGIDNEFVLRNQIKILVLAIREITPERKSKIISRALNAGLEVLETPSPDNWINGQLQIMQLRKIKLEDLLGREPIRLDQRRIEKELTGKIIMVTGAAGSIGSEIVRQLAQFSVKCLVLVDQSETPMFHLKMEIRHIYPDVTIRCHIADVTLQEKMELLFRRYKPQIVYHAAAYKHVPLMEENPHEAFRVNVGGTRVVSRLAVAYSAEKFVMISTDKAVNPTNIMGASKRVCEMIVQAKAQRQAIKTQFVITRFGNVLGSNGSVIPIFMKQIEEGGPVTVTHPEITRYFMTIPEACQLVLEAGFMGKGGEIFVFDMGKPVKIADLARQMIHMAGLSPGKDIKLEYTGLRPGEKLFEELLADREVTLPTHHSKIRIAKVEDVDRMAVLKKVDEALENIYTFSEQEMAVLFKNLVPEYLNSSLKIVVRNLPDPVGLLPASRMATSS